MEKRYFLCVALLVFLGLVCQSFSQSGTETLSEKKAIRAGLGFEYLKQTISWDDDSQESSLKSSLITLNGSIEIMRGFTVGAFVGYAFSNLDSLVFRKLPISLELDAGSISGFALGGQACFTLFRSYDFEISVNGQYIYYAGGKKEWEIPGLSVDGTAVGKPKWQRARIGLSFNYKGFDYFYPYVTVYFNRLRGNFEMQETIVSLSRTEDKEIKGKGHFGFGLGGVYEITDAISLSAEIDILPYGKSDEFKGGMDVGGIARILYKF